MGLSNKQRDWARRAYSVNGVLRCHFPAYSERYGCAFCGSDYNVHIHHIKPQRFLSMVFGENPNYPTNLIAVCALHHVGKGYKGSLDWREQLVEVIHPDMAWAFQQYPRLKGLGFERVFKGRDKLVAEGKTYWNTDWDEWLQLIADEVVTRYIRNHPDDPFPF